MRVQCAAATLRARHVYVEPSACSTRAVAGSRRRRRRSRRSRPSARPSGPSPGRCSGGHSGAAQGGAICFSGAQRPGRGQLAERAAPPAAAAGAGRPRRSRPHEPLHRPAPVVLLDVVARLLDQPVVLDARRARVTHAMQPRQRSKCSTTVSLSEIEPSTARPSDRCARAASPSPRATANRWGTSAGRSRSARSPRSARTAHRLPDPLG